VDALDAIEKPFAPFDRERFGASSRDRLITAVRERFELDHPEVALAGWPRPHGSCSSGDGSSRSRL
jgi:hypothetical protein